MQCFTSYRKSYMHVGEKLVMTYVITHCHIAHPTASEKAASLPVVIGTVRKWFPKPGTKYIFVCTAYVYRHGTGAGKYKT